jgi:DNA-binding NarL/FixJ family response regulator
VKSTAAKSSTRKHRIVIVDDHPIVRHGLSELLARESDVEVCGEAANVSDALRQVETTHPDLVVVDVSLEGDNGIQLVQQVHVLYPSVKMLVWSMHDEKVFAPRALRAGAHGYVNKHESIDQIMEAVRRVLSDEIYVSCHLASRLIHRAAFGEPLDDDPTSVLSNRELEVFELIGQGLNARQISMQLGLSPKTIESHRKSVKVKLHITSSTQLNRRAFLWVQEGH